MTLILIRDLYTYHRPLDETNYIFHLHLQGYVLRKWSQILDLIFNWAIFYIQIMHHSNFVFAFSLNL